MQELQQAVSAAFANIVASGAIEKAINDKLTKTVTDLVDEQLRSYSDFGTQLKEHIKSALAVNFDDLGIPGYNDFILKVVRRQVEAHTNNAIASQVEKQMAELLQPAPAQIKLSELVEQFIEANKNDDPCACGDGPSAITLIVERSQYGGRWIYLDKDEHKSKYECAIQFAVSDHDNTIYGLRLDRKKVNETLFIHVYGFERQIFQMHAAGTKLIVDEEPEYINTSYPGYDD